MVRSLYERELRSNRFSHYHVIVPTQPVATWPTLLGQGGYWLMGDEVHIVTLAVQPAWRGVGLGKWLLLRLLDEARQQGGLLATLEVRTGNQAARLLYERVGFQQIGQRKRYYPDGEDALVLQMADLADPVVWLPMAADLAVLEQKIAGGFPP